LYPNSFGHVRSDQRKKIVGLIHGYLEMTIGELVDECWADGKKGKEIGIPSGRIEAYLRNEG
jgi:hypothetical protein